jgi:DNA-binding CsgD family transcriptional regulator/tetratricopeptide (TPR) repeat protein
MPVSSSRSCPIFIERDDELAVLEHALAAAWAGTGQLAFIEGEAGRGKSRLISEFVSRAERVGALVIVGACSDRDRDFPFSPFVDAFRQWLASVNGNQADRLRPDLWSLSSLLPELAMSASDREGSPLPPEQEKRRLFEAIRSTLTRLATESSRPLLLVLEDLHWADSSSLQLLELLPRRLATTPILIVGSIRSGESNRDLTHCLGSLRRARAVTELSLAPLSGAAVDRMLEAMLPAPPPPAIARAIRSRTDGNPFFVEEIVAILPKRTDPRWLSGEGELPATVEEAILLQFANLEPEPATLADLVAVAGQSIHHVVLREAADLSEPELQRRLDPLLERGLLIESDEPGRRRYAFRHALTHEVLRSRLPASSRRALHRRVRAALEQVSPSGATISPELAGEIGFHAHASAEWDKALIYAMAAGDAAWQVRAVVEALAHDRRALDAATSLHSEHEPELQRRCGAALTLLGSLEPAQVALETALRLARDRGQVEIEQATLADLSAFFASRDYAAARRYAESSLAVARQIGEPIRIGRALNRLGNVLTNQLQFDTGRALHDEALAIFERLGERWGSADCLDLIGMARYLAGDIVEARAAFGRAAAVFTELGDSERVASALTSRGLYLAMIDGACATSEGPDQYRVDAAEGLRLARELSWRAGEAYALVALACADLGDGLFGNARQMAELALRISEDIDHQQWQIIALLTLSLVDASECAIDSARDRLRTAAPLARSVGADQWTERIESWLAALKPLADLPDAPRSQSPPASIGQRRLSIAAVERALSERRFADAIENTNRLLRGAAGPRPAEMLRLHAESLAGLNLLDEADAAFLEARRIAEAVGPTCQRWQIAIGRSRLWEEQNPSIAAAELVLARSEIMALAESEPDTERREAFLRAPAFRQIVAPAGRRRTRDRATPGGLTQREQEVAQRITGGMSNKEIARDLSISEKTVEMHVSSGLGKLGFTSRAQLAVWVARGELEAKNDTGENGSHTQGFP